MPWKSHLGHHYLCFPYTPRTTGTKKLQPDIIFMHKTNHNPFTYMYILLLCKGSNTSDETDGLITSRKTRRKRLSRTLFLVFLYEPISYFFVQNHKIADKKIKKEWSEIKRREKTQKDYSPTSGICRGIRLYIYTHKNWIVRTNFNGGLKSTNKG